MSPASWEHFHHQADIGVRGYGATKQEAFANAALALTAVVTDLSTVSPESVVTVHCTAPNDEILFVDWLNALVFEMATRGMLFSRFEVRIGDGHLDARAWGEPIVRAKHQPAVEIKGATYTELKVTCDLEGLWIAQTVVDV